MGRMLPFCLGPLELRRVSSEGHSPATQSHHRPDSCQVHLCTRTSHDSHLRDVCIDRAPTMCQACAKAAEMPWSLVVKTTGPRT